MKREELDKILELHKLWLQDDEKGQRANLQGIDLRGAYLWGADLQGADLQGIDLRGIDLRGADLQGADLQGANLDFSCWPLWCGSKKVKIDDKLFWQLCDHILVTDTENCSKDVARVKRYLERYGKRSHRAKELDL